ncbi:MAG: pilus assembly protein PilM, partial [Mariprofundaceae bacterium]
MAIANTGFYVNVFGQLKRLFASWVAELKPLFTFLGNRMSLDQTDQFIVHVDGDEVVVYLGGHDVSSRLGELDTQALNQPRRELAFDELLQCQGDDVKSIAISIPSHQLLRQTIYLPRAVVEEDLRQLLGFEVERLTPFHLADVYFDYAVINDSAVDAKVAVELAVVPRSVVDHALMMLGKYNVAVMGVFALDADGSLQKTLNLLPPERRQRHLPTATFRHVAVALLALLLLLVVIVTPLWQKRSVVVAMNIKIAEMSEAAGRASSLITEIDRLMSYQHFIRKKKEAQPTATEMTYRLTALLPEDTWVQRLSLEGRKLHLHGET